jgi:hypothetical protein
MNKKLLTFSSLVLAVSASSVFANDTNQTMMEKEQKNSNHMSQRTDRPEMHQEMRPQMRPEHRMGQRGDREQYDKMADKMFDKADLNKDGVISRQEALASASEHFDKIDLNKDGNISREEQKRFMEMQQEKFHHKKEHFEKPNRK